MDEQEKLTSMNDSLPASLRAFAEERASQGFSSASEYIRELIRRDQKEAAREKLEALLVEGLESGEPIVVTEEYWHVRLLNEAHIRRRPTGQPQRAILTESFLPELIGGGNRIRTPVPTSASPRVFPPPPRGALEFGRRSARSRSSANPPGRTRQATVPGDVTGPARRPSGISVL